jgi:hypothetical protein
MSRHPRITTCSDPFALADHRVHARHDLPVNTRRHRSPNDATYLTSPTKNEK